MLGEKKQINYQWLYESYVNELFSYGMALGIDRELLQDIIHDVFLHLFERPQNIKEEENLKYYLFRCLKNRLISLKRKEIPFESIDEADDYVFSIKVNGLVLIEEEEERMEIAGQIEQMLQSLTSRQREAIYLRFMQEMEYEQIADLLDVTPKGARKLIYRAIESIRETYGVTGLFVLSIASGIDIIRN